MTAFPNRKVGRLPHCRFRGLLGVYSRYGSLGCSLPKANSFLAGSDGSVALPLAAIATEADRQFLGQNFHLLDQISFMTHSQFPVHQFPARESGRLRGN